MLEKLEKLTTRFRGLRAAILLKDRKVILSQFDTVKTERLSDLIHCLWVATEERDNFERVVIETKSGKFFVFCHKNCFLGVLSEEEINIPLLKYSVTKTLEYLETEKVKEVDEIERRVKSFL